MRYIFILLWRLENGARSKNASHKIESNAVDIIQSFGGLERDEKYEIDTFLGGLRLWYTRDVLNRVAHNIMCTLTVHDSHLPPTPEAISPHVTANGPYRAQRIPVRFSPSHRLLNLVLSCAYNTTRSYTHYANTHASKPSLYTRFKINIYGGRRALKPRLAGRVA